MLTRVVVDKRSKWADLTVYKCWQRARFISAPRTEREAAAPRHLTQGPEQRACSSWTCGIIQSNFWMDLHLQSKADKVGRETQIVKCCSSVLNLSLVFLCRSFVRVLTAVFHVRSSTLMSGGRSGLKWGGRRRKSFSLGIITPNHEWLEFHRL